MQSPVIAKYRIKEREKRSNIAKAQKGKTKVGGSRIVKLSKQLAKRHLVTLGAIPSNSKNFHVRNKREIEDIQKIKRSQLDSHLV